MHTFQFHNITSTCTCVLSNYKLVNVWPYCITYRNGAPSAAAQPPDMDTLVAECPTENPPTK